MTWVAAISYELELSRERFGERLVVICHIGGSVGSEYVAFRCERRGILPWDYGNGARYTEAVSSSMTYQGYFLVVPVVPQEQSRYRRRLREQMEACWPSVRALSSGLTGKQASDALQDVWFNLVIRGEDPWVYTLDEWTRRWANQVRRGERKRRKTRT